MDKLPFSGEPFKGNVIKLNKDDFSYVFTNYSQTDEYTFRERLHRYDEWLSDKPYKVYSNWVAHIIKWLQPKEERRDDDYT